MGKRKLRTNWRVIVGALCYVWAWLLLLPFLGSVTIIIVGLGWDDLDTGFDTGSVYPWIVLAGFAVCVTIVVLVRRWERRHAEEPPTDSSV